jgi:hypothetical protein
VVATKTRKKKVKPPKGRFARGATFPWTIGGYAARQAKAYEEVMGRPHFNRFSDAEWNSLVGGGDYGTV